MWTPAPMARIFLVTLDRDLPQATEVLGRAGAVHLLTVAELGPWAHGLTWEQAASLAAQYDNYRRRIEGLLRGLALGPAPHRGPATVAPFAVAARAERLLPQMEAEVQQIVAGERQLQEEDKRLALAAQQLQLLARLPVDLAELRRLEFLHFAPALVPQENLERLRGSLAGVPHVILPLGRQNDQVLILVFVAQDQGEELARALRSAYARPADIPRGLVGAPQQALARVRARQAELERERAALEAERGALAARYGAEIRQMEGQLALNGVAVAAWKLFGATQRTRLVSGWAPAAAEPGLRTGLSQALAGRLALYIAPPVPQVTPTPEGPVPPTALRNPPVIKPFEPVVSTYGTPNYREIDPTPVAGPLFAIMFGLMLGDVGQGILLAIAGLLMARNLVLKGNRALGWLVTAAGLSGAFFGVLYGTVFLEDNLLPALWFQPLRNPERLIEAAIAFGIGVVSLGLLLNMADALRARDGLRLTLGPSGLAGLWFYWGAVVAVYAYLTGRSLAGGVLVALVGIPLVLIFLREPLHGLRAGGRRWAWPGAQVLVLSGIETFDTALRYLGNTISFIRLAAFAIAHVGIGVVVLTLAAAVRVPLVSALILVVGNALVLGLEGLVVAVQALRLDYYEFFSKFFRADGIPFRPFVLPGTPQAGYPHFAAAALRQSGESPQRGEG